jgi:hypothetical protein
MGLHSYISKYCEKMVLQRKYPKLCIISLYIMYVTTFYIHIIFHFPKKNILCCNTTDWKVLGGATYLEFFFHGGFPRLHIIWICHCNVGKTNSLKQNGNENIENKSARRGETVGTQRNVLKKTKHNKYVVNHSSILMISSSETVLVESKCIFNILQNKICSSVLVSGSLSKYMHFFLENEKKSARSFNFIFAI